MSTLGKPYRNAARAIRKNKEKILEIWKDRVKEELSILREYDGPIIIDNLEGWVDDLTLALTEGLNRRKLKRSIDHGFQRSRLPRYSISHLIREYRILRNLILEILRKEELLTNKLQDWIQYIIEESIEDSTLSFLQDKQQDQQEVDRNNPATNQEVEKQKKEKELMNQFLATIGHDLRTYVGVIKNSAEVLNFLEDAVSIRETGKIIERNANFLEILVQDLLNTHLIQAGQKLNLSRELVNLKDIVKNSLEDAVILFGDRFLFHLGLEEVKGFWDAHALKRILDNLLSNAAKYGDPNREITVKCWQQEQKSYFSVHNFGDPIPPEDLSLLFNIYFRAKQRKKSSVKGWGLGLTLVKGLVESHEGSIEVESDKERGTIFKVFLPNGIDLISN